MDDLPEVWVIDTSSIIAVREKVSGPNERKVFAALTSLVKTAQLIWPPEVSREVEDVQIPDSAVAWIKSNRLAGERSPSLETVKSVLKKAPRLVDPDALREQADPYVVALAVEMRSGDLFAPQVTIITEDKNDKPTKLSLATAAGLLRVPVVPLRAFLASQGIHG